jgi:hypothetical protein
MLKQSSNDAYPASSFGQVGKKLVISGAQTTKLDFT